MMKKNCEPGGARPPHDTGPALPSGDSHRKQMHMDKSMGSASSGDLTKGYCGKGKMKDTGSSGGFA